MSESKKTKKNFLQNWIVRNLLIAAAVALCAWFADRGRKEGAL